MISKIIGVLLLIGVFGGLIFLIAPIYGLKITLMLFSIAFFVAVLIIVAVFLIAR